jgi:hypothetical protein
MQTWDIAAGIIAVVILGTLAFEVIRVKILNRGLFKKTVQAELDLLAVSDKLNKVILEHNAEKTDGFLKFMSESRDKAFGYIEDVQAAIQLFEEELGPIVKHYKKTGKPVSRKQSETLDKIEKIYDILIDLIPKN